MRRLTRRPAAASPALGSCGIALFVGLELPCSPGLGVENLLELLGQAGLHAGPGVGLGIAIAALLTGRF